MAPLPQRILLLVSQTPGLTDRQIASELQGASAPQQPVNIAARGLAKKGRLIRRRRDDGLIGNYLRGAAEAPIREGPKIPATASGEDLRPFPNWRLRRAPQVIANQTVVT